MFVGDEEGDISLSLALGECLIGEGLQVAKKTKSFGEKAESREEILPQ